MGCYMSDARVSAGGSAPPQLQRVLSLGDLVFYGIVLITPMAPVGIFGIAGQRSGGHAATTILLAMAAMTLTASSYGRMAARWPSAGSAYAFVGRGLNRYLGFLAGWAMFLDYLIIPVLNTIYVALTLGRLAPRIPFAAWVSFTVLAMTLLNLRGIRYTARASRLLLAAMAVVILVFLVLSVRYLLAVGGWGGLLSLKPFYNPATFDWGAIGAATSLAALTYIGFDGVTTLAEEANDPRRTVPLATVLVCVVTGLLSTLQVYLAQQAWPDYTAFPNLETAFLDVTARVGGPALFKAVAAVLIVSCFGSGLTGQAGAARLLYGMGRDGVLPRRLFGHVDAHRRNPTYNVLLLAILTFGGALLVSYELAAALLNFGAFLSFLGVNLAALRHSRPAPAAASALGFLFCLWIWLSLPRPAKIAGSAWLLAGILYCAIQTRGFRRPPAAVDFPGA
jgi:putrescine importer